MAKGKLKQLDEATHRAITAHTDRGSELFDREQYRESLEEFSKALKLVPEPKENWEAATWVLTAIGDAYFFLDDYAEAHEAFAHAVACPGGLGNWFIHLRLGEIQFELDNLERARDELARAYMGGGKEAFANEDPKYFEFIRKQMRGIDTTR